MTTKKNDSKPVIILREQLRKTSPKPEKRNTRFDALPVRRVMRPNL